MVLYGSANYFKGLKAPLGPIRPKNIKNKKIAKLLTLFFLPSSAYKPATVKDYMFFSRHGHSLCQTPLSYIPMCILDQDKDQRAGRSDIWN